MTQKPVTQEAELSSQLQLFLALFGYSSFSSHVTFFFLRQFNFEKIINN